MKVIQFYNYPPSLQSIPFSQGTVCTEDHILTATVLSEDIFHPENDSVKDHLLSCTSSLCTKFSHHAADVQHAVAVGVQHSTIDAVAAGLTVRANDPHGLAVVAIVPVAFEAIPSIAPSTTTRHRPQSEQTDEEHQHRHVY